MKLRLRSMQGRCLTGIIRILLRPFQSLLLLSVTPLGIIARIARIWTVGGTGFSRLWMTWCSGPMFTNAATVGTGLHALISMGTVKPGFQERHMTKLRWI